ncbi:autotransporter domain-containing protein [Gallibacterium anatis]|uniref:autotransporter domain-containing protein n=1 Tax=Gallibacterium anatis TaxID=750 RepID=UPI00254C3883|nr:autotransporter domain-containing protein [Gallibacterium anatis]WIM82443.1 autotransporter domain-containing protein [Gallibacterium anatis]
MEFDVVVGGHFMTTNPSGKDVNIKTDSIHLSTETNFIENIIGGSRLILDQGLFTSSINSGSIAVNVKGGSIGKRGLTGGNLIGLYSGNLNGISSNTDNIKVTLSDITDVWGDVIGGSQYYRSNSRDIPFVEIVDKKTNVIINSGTFKHNIFGGNSIYDGVASNIKSRVDDANIEINGGVIEGFVFGGSDIFANQSRSSSIVKSAKITINNGIIDRVVAGSASQDQSPVLVENAVVNLNGGKVGSVLLGNLEHDAFPTNLNSAVLNYNGGEISNSRLDYYDPDNPGYSTTGITVTAKNAEINLNNHLNSDVLIGKASKLTINGNNHSIGVMKALSDSQVTINNVQGNNIAPENAQVSVNDSLFSLVEVEKGSKVTLSNMRVSSDTKRYSASGEGTLLSINNLVDAESDKAKNLKLIASDNAIINVNANITTTPTFNVTFFADGGVINLASGNISGPITLGRTQSSNNINLIGATYSSNDLLNDIKTTTQGKLVLKDRGILQTVAGQVFNNGDATTADDNALSSLAVKADILNKISFEGGTLKLVDDLYSMNYYKQTIKVFKDLKNSINQGPQRIWMAGKLVEPKMTVSEAVELGKDVALDKVTARTSSANLIIGSNESTDSEVRAINASAEKVSSGFNVGKLDLQTGSKVVSINQNNEVTLGGTEGGEVLLVNNQPDPNLNVVVGSSDKDAGILNLGNDQVTAATQLALTANMIVKNHSQLNTRGTTTINGDVSLADSTLDTHDGTLTLSSGKTLEVKGNSSLTGMINADKLAAASASDVVNIGTSSKAGKVSIKQVDLAGATLFLDPQWQSGQTIADGTSFATNSLNNTKVVVGNNSVFVYGTDAATAYNAFNSSGLSWGNGAILSAAYLAGSLDLANNSLVVNSLANASSGVSYGALSIGKNALLMVDGSKVSGSQAAALTNVVTANVGADAKLYLDNVSDGETYNIMSGTDVETNNSWYVAANADANGNVLTYQSLYKLMGAANNSANRFGLTAKLQSASTVYGPNSLLIQNVVNNTLSNHSGTSAKAFFDKAMNSLVNTTLPAQIDAFNSAAAMSSLGNVTYGAYKSAGLMNETLTNHLSTIEDTEYSKNVWVRYIHTKDDISGLNGVVRENGDARHHGLVLGLDLYREAGNAVGLAFTHINSKYKNSTLATETTNKAKYFGFSAYGRANIAGLAVLADASYVKGDNELTQYNSGYRLTGTQDTAVISVGTTVEKIWKVADSHTLTPYAGVRYLNLDSGNYTNSVGLSYSQDKQNLFVLPVGVRYQATLTSGEWKVNPSLDLGYAWNIGNRQAKQTVRYANVADSFTYNVVDKGNFVGKVGIEAQRGNFVYSLGYEHQKGSSVKSNRYMANVSYQF